MANTKSKIERLGLERRVQDLMRSGVVTGRAIAECLNEELAGQGHTARLSPAAVNRYLAPLRDTLAADAFRTIRDHVEKVLPTDLQALEDMERQCLAWAAEPVQDQIARIARASVELPGEVGAWVGMLASSSPEKRGLLIKEIIGRCLEYIMRDGRQQAKRLAAMAEARKVIELKLKHAGLLGDDEGKGRIIIMDRSHEGEVEAVDPGSAARGGRTTLDLTPKKYDA